jgi:hypothetical protein
MTGTVAHTTPYAWPYDGTLDPARTALVVVGPSGDPGPRSGSAEETGARVDELAGSLRALGGVVVCVTTTPPGATPGRTPGPFRTDLQLEAAGVDGFFGSRLDHLLRSLGRDQLLVVGGWLESNVHSTLRSANDRGYECLLVLDACTPYDAALVAASRSQVEMSGGIFGAVGETAHVLAALAALRPSERNLA